ARNADKLAPIVEDIATAGGRARAYACDGTEEADVIALCDAAEADLGPMGVAVYNASGRARGPIAETTLADFVDAWRRSCLGGFLLGREAARRLVQGGRGSILFTGATASMKGYPHSATFAVGKFGLRALAESMARELHPQGIHVAHFNIDGGIGEDGGDARLRPDAIAETYYQVHAQHRSAWSHHVEVRPWVENF
ncbi:MAG: SDR family NAD(P)-dependent oxidoreductase, partial [Alphaproteobacteria bacterium]|nr:SDR family NAD(P)-dependent oxidoreductase [Alphaproteobacteria bacterium]